jgi:hypothetical protein
MGCRQLSRLMALSIGIVVATNGCVWTFKGEPYPMVSQWPPTNLSKVRSLGLTIKTSLFADSHKSDDAIEFDRQAHRAAYQAFKESGHFDQIQIGSHEGLDCWADITILRSVSAPPGWWVPASLYLIPSRGESSDIIVTQFYDKQRNRLGSFSQKVTIGGYVHLLFILAWPLEQLTRPYSQERAMYDAQRAIILEAAAKHICMEA